MVLTGVSVTVEDDRLVTLDDLSSNYFLRDSDIGMTVDLLTDLQRGIIRMVTSTGLYRDLQLPDKEYRS